MTDIGSESASPSPVADDNDDDARADDTGDDGDGDGDGDGGSSTNQNGSRDEFATLSYEFRRHLAVVYGNSELLLEEAFGSLTPDQQAALEEIIVNTSELTALTAHAFETNDIEDAVDRTDALPESTGTDESTLADPDEFDPIVLAFQSEPFAELVAEQLELAGHEAALVDGIDESAGLDTPYHLVVDCGFPTTEIVERLAALAQPTNGQRSITLASTVDPVVEMEETARERAGTKPGARSAAGTGATVGVAGPLLGIDGILDPAASRSTVAELVADELVHTVDTPSISTVHVAGDETEALASSLAEQSYTVQRQTTATLPELNPDGDSCLFLGTDVFDRCDALTLSRFRSPADTSQRPIPIIAVAETPFADRSWIPTCGADLFAHKPVTATEFAAELLCSLPDGDG
ncbi:histidine kinase [Natrialba magadii ATCC 43099]|nr:hypothetical protein [Natrialba magadii]ELY25369.1 histidine kinase [Natrialba magadii ATCC 43099]